MLNEFSLIGRLVDTPELKKYDDEGYVANVKIAVSRPFKNQDGEYTTDFLRISVWDSLAKNTCDYCRKGDLVCIKGRITSRNVDIPYSKDDPTMIRRLNLMELVGSQVIFLQVSGKQHEDHYPDIEDIQ